MRFQNPADLKPKIQVVKPNGQGMTEAVLFFATHAGKGVGDGLVSVSHEGKKYIIPASLGVEHRSMEVLSVLNQLIGLNQSRSETPETGVVTVVGG